MVEKKVLYTWLGMTDIKKSQAKEPGPIVNALSFAEFDVLRIISDQNEQVNIDFKKNLPKSIQNATEMISVSLPVGPTNHQSIFEIVYNEIKNRFDENEILFYHVSSGTPAMHAIWLIISQAYFSGTLIESNETKPTREVKLPFNIQSEFIPVAAHKKAIAEIFEPPLPTNKGFEAIIHQSEIMKETIAVAQKLSKFDIPILIQGESGTGKELFAQAIHIASKRIGKFIAVNCGAIPNELLEGELFGYKKGAFTGANADKTGIIEASHNGTLFLDEIAELPLNAQVKLLRVLQENEVMPIGETQPRKVNLRVIAASHKDLKNEVSQDSFREDLFYRLAVGFLKIPPLRERTGDLPLIMAYLLEKFNSQSRQNLKKGKIICQEAIEFAEKQNWPGNIRELNNTIIRAIIYTTTNKLTEKDIEKALLSKNSDDKTMFPPLTQPIDLNQVSAKLEMFYIEQALKNTKNRTKAAELLGLNSRQALDAREASYKKILGLA